MTVTFNSPYSVQIINGGSTTMLGRADKVKIICEEADSVEFDGEKLLFCKKQKDE